MFGSMQATGGRWWGRSWIGHHIALLTWEKKYQHTLSHSWPHYDIDDLIQQSNDVSAIIQHQDMLRCINRDVYHIHDVWNIPIRCDALHTAKATAPSSNSTYFANIFKNKLPTSWRSRLIFSRFASCSPRSTSLQLWINSESSDNSHNCGNSILLRY